MGKPDPKALREALSDLIEQGEILEEHLREIAKLTRARYEALVESGFTAEQALELCKHPSVM